MKLKPSNLLFLGIAIIAQLYWAALAYADTRVALVIGNSDYAVSPLQNPSSDTDAIAKALGEIGFDTVVVRKNLGAAGLKNALREFSRFAAGADIAVVFYAGHGMEMAGRNYLIPVDARLERASDIDLEAVSLDTVLGQLEGVRTLKLVILDACRNSAFRVAGGTRAVTRGLARIEPEDNTLVAYAARAGTTAEDGTARRHSPFTDALLKHIETPGLEVRLLLGRVRDDVVNATAGAQTPHVYGTLGGQAIYLRAPEAGAAVTAPAPIPSGAAPGAVSTVVVPPKVEPPESPVVPAVGIYAARHKPGDTFRDCDVCPEMVAAPAGSFMMGSPANEDGRKDNEGPQHKVTINSPFAAGRFPVTRGQFESFVKETSFAIGNACKDFQRGKWDERPGRSFRTPGFTQNQRHPVVCINWDEAKAYVAWLTRRTGKDYRLLTEAEWEYAARGGTTTPYSTGHTISTAQANFGHTVKKPSEVGSYSGNPFGFHDMHGNVYEWVEDCWHDSYAGAPTDGSSWITGACTERVSRNGCFADEASDLRSANRFGAPAIGSRSILGGFRVARTLEP